MITRLPCAGPIRAEPISPRSKMTWISSRRSSPYACVFQPDLADGDGEHLDAAWGACADVGALSLKEKAPHRRLSYAGSPASNRRDHQCDPK
jgi:hypothetical protein